MRRLSWPIRRRLFLLWQDGRQKRRGGASNPPEVLPAPTLSWTSGTADSTPDLAVTFPDILVTGAIVTLEYADNSGFTGATSVVHELTSPEALAQAISLALTALTDGAWYIRVKYDGSAWSNTETKTIDAPPTLTLPVGTQTGTTTANLSVTTDQSGGTLYWVITTSATPPSAAQVKAGQNNTGSAAAASGNQSVASPGAQLRSVTGLTAGTTYYAYFMQEDASTLQSNVAAASSFATSTGTPTLTFVGVYGSPTGSATDTRGWTVDIGNPAYIGTRRVIAIMLGCSSGRNLNSALINGVTAGPLTTVDDPSGNGLGCQIASAVVTAGTTSVPVSFTLDSADFAAQYLAIFIVDDTLLSSPTPTTTFNNAAAASVTSNAASRAVLAGGSLILANIRSGGSSPTLSVNDAGLAVDFDAGGRLFAHASNLSAATYNETVSWTTAAFTGLTLIAYR